MLDRRVDPYRPGLRAVEHIDIGGHLCVPLARSTDKAPERPGWTPFFVNVNLNDDVQKVVKYKQV